MTAPESSDFNDGTILAATRQELGEKGTVRFIIKLPSGRDLTSEFFSTEHIRTAMKTWLETARAEMAADVASMKRAKQPAKSLGDVSRALDLLGDTSVQGKPEVEHVFYGTSGPSPLEFARIQAKYWDDVHTKQTLFAEQTAQRIAEAASSRKKWSLIVKGLEAAEIDGILTPVPAETGIKCEEDADT